MNVIFNNLDCKRALALFLSLILLATPVFPQTQTDDTNTGYTFKVNTDLVLVNVTVRDKDGQPITGLKPSDFTLLEDGRPQRILSFDFENIETVPLEAQQSVRTGVAAPRKDLAATLTPEDVRNHRLVVLFFDFTAMEPDQIDRAVAAAQKYVAAQLTAADLVAVVSLASQMQVDQDFTTDRDLLNKALARYTTSAGQGFENGATGTTEGTADTGGAFTPDDTEYNAFNTDRKLYALESLAQSMAKIQQKKSIVYFSSGIQRTGIENQAALRAATNAAIRSNVAIYPVDTRGLEALPPTGDATTASLRGVSAYNGAATRNQLDSNFATQETLTTLAGDTGGKAFLDTNDFSGVFTRVQRDTSVYYVLGFKSTNLLRDGRYRKLAVRVNRPNVKLEYRAGYYAPRDFKHSNRDDREQQLAEELASELPSTDFPVYLSAAYFRLDDNRFYVPVSVVIPGSEIPFTQSADKDRATLDVIGYVRQAGTGRDIGGARETVKLNLDQSQQVHRKNVQYNTGFELPPGAYHLKFVVRENQTGRMGSFETDLTIPDYRKVPLKLSSVMLASQRQESKRKNGDNPLIRDGMELVPNVAHVFTTDQHLYFFYEVYEPAKQTAEQLQMEQLREEFGRQRQARQDSASANANAPQQSAQGDQARAEQTPEPSRKPVAHGAVRVLTSIQFFMGKVKVYETPLVESRQLNVPERKAAAFEFDVPLSRLRPGYYTCQINIIDDAAGTFAFPRLPILVREQPAAQQPAAGAP